jgi:hypothetical protein
MKAVTSPAITAVSGGYEIAFQATTGALWTVGASGSNDTGLSMAATSSPSIAANSANVYEAAFQSSSGQVDVHPLRLRREQHLPMMAGTDPAIAALPGNGFEVAYQANSTALWIQTPSGGGVNWSFGMHSGSSPSIAY